jgi:hypothetical protein
LGEVEHAGCDAGVVEGEDDDTVGFLEGDVYAFDMVKAGVGSGK